MTPDGLDIEIVAAVSRNMVIGDGNRLPWDIKEDLVHFRDLTKGHIVVMGKTTFLSIPNAPLKDRINIVITSTPEIFVEREGCVFVHPKNTIQQILAAKEEHPHKRVFVIGGAHVYSTFINLASKLHITHIDKVYKGDCKFPAIQQHHIASFTNKMFSDNEGCHFQYITYERTPEDFPRPITNDMRYLKLLNAVIHEGSPRKDRTGTGTTSLFGRQARFDIRNHVPLLTTKQVAWKSCIRELLWFLKGQTDATLLKEQGVRIWDGNTTREFLDARGLTHLPEGDIGCGYGFQWRHFGAHYQTCRDDYGSQGFDQIKYIINELKNDPFSRRIFMSAWNPAHMSHMALPPCHVSAQFYAEDAPDGGPMYLSCHMYQRSVDSFLGLPFNIFSYTALTYIIATISGMRPKELIISTGDTHVYNDHINQVLEQVSRYPVAPPKLVVNPRIKDIAIEDITMDDFEVVGYFHHPPLKGNMSV